MVNFVQSQLMMKAVAALHEKVCHLYNSGLPNLIVPLNSIVRMFLFNTSALALSA